MGRFNCQEQTVVVRGKCRRMGLCGSFLFPTILNSRHIVSGGEDGTITIWNSDLDVQQKSDPPRPGEKSQHRTCLRTRRRWQAGQKTAGSASGASRWASASLGLWPGQRICLGQVTCIQFSPQGDRIGTVANSEPSLCIWNNLTGDLLLNVQYPTPCASLVE